MYLCTKVLYVFLFSLENHLYKLREIDAPVAPYMSAFGLAVFVSISFLVEITAEVRVLLIEEICLTDGNPV